MGIDGTLGQPKSIPVQIRFIDKNQDLESILAIERVSFPSPWGLPEFYWCFQNLSVYIKVAEYDGKVVGYVIYEQAKDELIVHNMAVHYDYRHAGVGRQLIERLVAKLVREHKRLIEAVVREANLDAHLFLKACGFKAVEVLRQCYEDSDEDGYRFVYELGQECWPSMIP